MIGPRKRHVLRPLRPNRGLAVTTDSEEVGDVVNPSPEAAVFERRASFCFRRTKNGVVIVLGEDIEVFSRDVRGDQTLYTGRLERLQRTGEGFCVT